MSWSAIDSRSKKRDRVLAFFRLQFDELVGDRLAVEKTPVLRRVFPFLDRSADNAAIAVAHADAFDFLVQNGSTHECRSVTAGIADQRPTHRFGISTVMVPMPSAFPGVFPEELAVKFAGRAFELEPNWRYLDHPLKRMK